MKITQPSEYTAWDAANPGAVKVLIHSYPGGGKTRLCTSLPWGSPLFGDRAVYVPFDVKERELRGVLAHHRPHIVKAERQTEDPYTFMMNVLDKDWEKEEGARNLILDTNTNWSHDLMDAAVNSSAYAVKTAQIGAATLRMSDKPHYGLVHKMHANAIRKIKQSPMNVFALYWSDWTQPEGGQPGGLYGGPTTVNMSMAKTITGEFDNVFYLRTEAAGQGKVDYYLHTAPYGFWEAKLHGGGIVNPMPVRKLEGDPVGFWREFEEVQGK